tara:strand:- start:86 stop:463 length:378 start_codon:yes stop_codon:yes gene_type:complete
MNKIVKIFMIVLALSACAHAQTDNRDKALEYFSKAGLFDFCSQGGLKEECGKVNLQLIDSEFEIYHYKNSEKKESLVVYETDSFYPFSILGYDKDSKIYVISSGLWLENKTELISGFIEEGDFSE